MDKKELFLVPYSHLDTQWRWDYPTTIKWLVRRTMRKNFRLFKRYPHYVFNFTGSRRYSFMKEYYPEDYKKVQEYVKMGKWVPGGACIDETENIRRKNLGFNIKIICFRIALDFQRISQHY